ncbi:nitroreductase family protein [uncultured Ilyobacter sp.]|uniref:nitroreductase family protein n=1 Tax=uncultured Ilyobacter sp. TaxID=544433 RepID=UPI0029C9012B|nr:nitroreductase family protein [uncultured Ilyobacter sp.]
MVDDSKKLKRLSHAKPGGTKFVEDTPVAIVVLGDEESDIWIEDCSIAMAFMQLEAKEMGIGACWVQINKRPSEDGRGAEALSKEIISTGKDRRVLAVLAMGYPDQERPAYIEEDMDFSKVYYNTYGSF